MKSWKWSALVVCLSFVAVLFVMGPSPKVTADPPEGVGKADQYRSHVLRREGLEPRRHGPMQEFSFDLPGEDGPYCSGACDCELCVCSGTLGCCLDGCDACWEVADEVLLCGAV